MKTTKNIFAMFAMAALAALCGFAQTPEKPANPKYDAELANKVGADAYGMRRYVVAILKTGPNDAAVKGEERSKLMKGHLDNIKRLAAEGKMAMAGPFGKNNIAFRGLFILAVATIEEAKKLTDTDPTIKAGILIVDLVPWFGSAALSALYEIDKKIAEESY